MIFSLECCTKFLNSCGKTLLARKLGSMLSPLRPITLVSGPEIMDKYVGSSEANLREIFDNPPPIYDKVSDMFKDRVDVITKTALHVIIMDEFDAMARARGGSSGKGDSQGDAGVARDSVVNQMLAKMDGVDELCVPTLVIGLTNRRSLIEPALLRSGRFEVQIEVPPPATVEQRVAILEIHTSNMFQSGRLLVRDAPTGTAAHSYLLNASDDFKKIIPTYKDLLHKLGSKYCEGFSGASLAGVSRAAASHALERAVTGLAEGTSTGILEECIVTTADFELAVKDVRESMSMGDTAAKDEK